MEITPAQPSEGAVFLRLVDVPDGWEVAGYGRTGEVEWYALPPYRRTMLTPPLHVVEARPPKPRMVTVEVASNDLTWLVEGPLGNADHFEGDGASGRLYDLFCAALAALDGEK